MLRDWRLPESFTRLRQALEQRHGATAGARQYIRVLQLLAEHPADAGPASRGSLYPVRGGASRTDRRDGAAVGRAGHGCADVSGDR